MGDRDYLLLAAGMNLLTWGWAADLVCAMKNRELQESSEEPIP